MFLGQPRPLPFHGEMPRIIESPGSSLMVKTCFLYSYPSGADQADGKEKGLSLRKWSSAALLHVPIFPLDSFHVCSSQLFPEISNCVPFPCPGAEIFGEQEREYPADALYSILFGSSFVSTTEKRFEEGDWHMQLIATLFSGKAVCTVGCVGF